MTTKTVQGFAILIVFVLLWIPAGQSTFLISHWMKLGTLMLPLLLFVAFKSHEPGREPRYRSPGFVAILLLAAYLIHQFEEHWIDVLGNQYAFQGSINALVQNALVPPPDQIGPLTEEAIFFINTSLVWLVAAIAIWQAPERTFPTLALAAIVIVNGIVHIAGSILTLKYNPGLLTSVLIFVPFAILAYMVIPARRAVTFLSVAWAVSAHIIMAIGMMASTWWGLISPPVYYAILVAWSVLPLALSMAAPRKLEDKD